MKKQSNDIPVPNPKRPKAPPMPPRVEGINKDRPKDYVRLAPPPSPPYGYQPTNKLDTSNPPKGGSAIMMPPMIMNRKRWWEFWQ